MTEGVTTSADASAQATADGDRPGFAVIADGAAPPGDALSVEGRMLALVSEAAAFAGRSRGPGTVATYASAMRSYSVWCQAMGLAPLSGDPLHLALYMTRRALDGVSVSSIRLARAAVLDAHRSAGVAFDGTDARLLAVMEGIVRTHGERPARKAAAAVPEVLRALADAPPPARRETAASAVVAVRDRSILLLGYGAALRRSEVAALSMGDVRAAGDRGLVVLVRRSKTDQRGQGKSLAVAANRADPSFCPLRAWEAWVVVRSGAAGLEGDPLYCAVSRSGRLHGGHLDGRTVSNVVQAAAAAAGLDASRFSGHSLRRGLLTDAGERQVPIADVMRHSRHKSVDTALGYMEEGDMWRNNASDGAFR